MKIENPNYYIKLKMNECPRLVAINGIDLEQDFEGSTSYAEYPINHYIKNGENTFELAVGEQDFMEEATSHSSTCVVEVRVKGIVNDEEVDYKVTDLTYTPKYTGDIKDLYSSSAKSGQFAFSGSGDIVPTDKNPDFSVSDIILAPIYYDGVGITLQRNFTAEVPFPKWSFFDGEQIFPMPYDEDDYEDHNDVVVALVLDMRKLFEEGDLDKILPLFEMRSREIDQAFYKTPGTTQDELRKSLEYVYKKKFPVLHHDEENMQLVVSYDGKLVTIVDAGNMAGTIYFRDTETDTFTFYTIYWMKKDGKWIIAR